jgi:hypothetical protein
MKVKPTHGEAFYQRKKAFESSETSALNMRAFDTIPPRMGRAKAVKYYTNKLRRVFDETLGEIVNMRDFIKPEHYHDYMDLKKDLNKLRG